jgi:uncharacterized protein
MTRSAAEVSARFSCGRILRDLRDTDGHRSGLGWMGTPRATDHGPRRLLRAARGDRPPGFNRGVRGVQDGRPVKIAIVGGGVSGLTAAYLLHRAHDVELFDANDYAGGHANTVVVPDPHTPGRQIPLDVGFIVYNEPTYPGFSRLLRELEVETQPSDMSFSVRCEEDGLEFSSRGIRGYLAQRRNLFSGSHLRMLFDFARFQRDARRALRRDDLHDLSFSEYLDRRGFNEVFRERLIVPLLSSTWSNSPASIMGFPAHYLFRFLEQHGVLAPNSIPDWRWLRGGSRTYVERMVQHLPVGSVHLATPIREVSRAAGGQVQVAPVHGDARVFDAVVLASHADEALSMLGDASTEEREALAGFRYEPNHVVLHTDERLLPRRERARAAWNYHSATRGSLDREALTMTYDLNRLQGIDSPVRYCVSTNPESRIDPAKVLARFDYQHPVFTSETPRAQRALEAVNGTGGVYFAGAYQGYGFHEDGLQSAVRVAQRLGVQW